ncbi:cation channel sperm-associated auxiliary subunit beta-like [Heptranchias perlo]|uniref:cation channel sperm-associated auxiliary subunit beta-like n=1 Tax=Heptranchias perlo TaxID=212740 RepID=UPI00355AC5AD
MDAWHLDIPREKIVTATDVYPADEWNLRLKLHYGSRLFLTEGTLLDVVREPILQWKLGIEVQASDVLPILQTADSLIIVRRLCASDVAILAPLFNRNQLSAEDSGMIADSTF